MKCNFYSLFFCIFNWLDFFTRITPVFAYNKSIIFSKSCLLDTAWNDSFVTTSGMVLSWVKVHHQEALFQEVSCYLAIITSKKQQTWTNLLEKKIWLWKCPQNSLKVISHLYPPIIERRTNWNEWMAHLNDECRTMYRYHFVTAFFKNTRILKFKSQLTFAFFAAVDHFSGPLRKQNFT